MVRTRPGLVLLATTAVMLAAGTPPALAKTAPKRGNPLALAVDPAKPTVGDTIRVTFTAGRLASDQRYDVRLDILSTDNAGCIPSRSVRVRGARRAGRRVTVELSPVAGVTTGNGRFCSGRGTLVVSRVDIDARAVTLAKRTFNLVTDDPGIQEPFSTPVRMEILEGSALLVQAPGRPDRSLPLGGVLRGALPGRFKPLSDIQPQGLTGSIFLRSVSPDALCAGATYTADLGVSTPAAILLKATGDASMPLTLAASPAALAGCAGAPAGTTPLTFTGKVGPQGLVRLALSASVAGVPIADGVTATVTANLFVKLDLSGKG